ncbi:MAG: flagellar hook-associated protein FlgK [Massilia sp.]|nr:flagellar hook-associated protein FlgK [Massilia sp.]
MAGNLLSIGKSGLFAAQAGLATTGHNIANANVAGYSRQLVVQASASAQNMGYGFVGSGTQIADIKRYSDEFLNTQVRNAQAQSSSLAAYGAQIDQVDNMLADTTSGLSPALQDFFKSVQDLSANASSTPSRQNLLSSAESLAARFQGLNGRLEDIRTGVNGQITSNVTLINSYAQQIAKLNLQISTLATGTGNAPNDLLDQRDQLLVDLNKQVKATMVRGDNDSVTVSIGNGQPLVVGDKAFQLAVSAAADDPTRVEVGYVTGSKVTLLAESSFSGGELGGLMEFRANSLDQAQNSLGRIAISLGASFNAQNRLGMDSSGNMGGDLFNVAKIPPGVNLNPVPPDPSLPTTLTTTITDASALTSSDYSVAYDATNAQFVVTRLSDKDAMTIAYSQPGPATLQRDGLSFTVSGNQKAGDAFVVRPTINGARDFGVAAKSVGEIAAAGPVITAADLKNKGSAKLTSGSVDTNFVKASFVPVTLAFNAATNELTGFPSGQVVRVTDAAGAFTDYTGGSVPYVAGNSYSFSGVTMSFSGQPIDKDQFTVSLNSGGVSDNRNMMLMGALQSKPLLDGKTATYQAAFAQLVGLVGNKAREVQVNGQASDAMLSQASSVQQGVAGVNLDEEASNLLKYQQAYQAAGKVMQIASTLFDTLLSLGR